MRVAISSKSWTTSALCDRVVATKRHKRHIRQKMNFVLCAFCAFLWLLIEFLFINLALTFFDGHDAIGSDVRNFINRAAGPTHLDRINFRALLESEVQSQITLGKITVAAANFVRLR